MSDKVFQGDVVRVGKPFNARAFSMEANERIDAAFAAFNRDGRTPRLVQLESGAELVALTDTNDSGWLYGRYEADGKVWAVQILGGSYHKLKAAA